MLGFSFLVFDALLFFQYFDNVGWPELTLTLMLQCNYANNFSSSTWKSTQPTDRLAHSGVQLTSSALFKGYSHLSLFTTRTLSINIIVRMINVHDQFCLILWTLFNFRCQDNLAEALAENPGFVQVETIYLASTPFFTFDIKCQFPEINSLEVCIALGNHGQWKYQHFYYYHVFFRAPKPTLPTVNTATISKPHESETFRVGYNLWNYVKWIW